MPTSPNVRMSLRDENARLKRLLADLVLKNDLLQLGETLKAEYEGKVKVLTYV